MADYDTLTLVGRHVPEQMVNSAGNPASPQELGYDTTEPTTGMYEIGALIDGAFVPILTEKASLIFDAVALAKKNAPEPEPETETPETGPLSGQGTQPSQPQG